MFRASYCAYIMITMFSIEYFLLHYNMKLYHYDDGMRFFTDIHRG